jgi:hypothetical protein
MGLLTSAPNRRMVVSQSNNSPLANDPTFAGVGTPRTQDLGLTQLAGYFVEAVVQQGYQWTDVQQALAQAYSQRSQDKQTSHPRHGTPPNLCVVNEHADILPVLQHELSQSLDLPVQTLTIGALSPEALKALVPKSRKKAPKNQPWHLLVTRYHVKSLAKALNHWPKDAVVAKPDYTVVALAPGTAQKDWITKVPPGGLIALVSASAIILQQAEAVVAALRGSDVSVRAMSIDENPRELKRVIDLSQLVLADTWCLPKLQPLTHKTLYPIPLLCPDSLQALQGTWDATSAAVT